MKQLPAHLADYVPVKERIAKMREDHPEWSMRPSVQILDGYYLGACDIHDGEGRHIATGSALETAGKAFDYEKAETSAVGRALVFAGYIDSVELSREETERAEVVSGTRRPDKGPVKVGDSFKPGRISPPPPPEHQIDGIDEPPTEPKIPLIPPRTVKQIATALPVQSAPKAVWRDYIAEFAAATADEGYDLDWKLMSAGKHFGDCTIDDLKLIALKASDIVKGETE